MDRSAIARQVEREYDVGTVDGIVPRSPTTYVAQARSQAFVYKFVGREDVARLYPMVADVLSDSGIRHPNPVPNRAHPFLSESGHVLYPYIPGGTPERLDGARFQSLLRALARDHRLLRAIPFQPDDLLVENMWDELVSIDAVRRGLRRLAPLLPAAAGAVVDRAFQVLFEHRGAFLAERGQIVHSDLGPDSMVFEGPSVTGFIDFTPAYAQAGYGLAHGLHWTCFYPTHRLPETPSLRRVLDLYGEAGDPPSISGLWLQLVRAGAYRVVGRATPLIKAGAVSLLGVERPVGVLAEIPTLPGAP